MKFLNKLQYIEKRKKILIVQYVVISLFIIILLIVIFKAGNEFYYMKNTLKENKKINIISEIGMMDFCVKIIVDGKENIFGEDFEN